MNDNSLLNRPYPFSRGWKAELIWIICIVLVASIVLFQLKPFGLANIAAETAYNFSITILVILMIYAILVQVILTEFLSDTYEAAWTTGKEIIWTSFYINGVAFLTYGVALSYQLTHLTSIDATIFVLVTFIVSIIPVSITVLLNQNFLLRKTLSAIEQLPQTTISSSDELITIRGQSNDSLTIPLKKLLYIKAQQNYSEVFFIKDKQVSSKLIRITFRDIQKLLPQNQIIRCHRSYIVNHQNIVSVDGNAQGYQLELESVAEYLPVSRSYLKKFNDSRNQFGKR